MATPVTRSGFYVEPGCGIPSTESGFLPNGLVGFNYYGVGLASDFNYKIWYPGALKYSILKSDSTYYSSSSCSVTKRTFSYNVTWEPVNTGTTYTYDF
jgi:hypothetical protein